MRTPFNPPIPLEWKIAISLYFHPTKSQIYSFNARFYLKPSPSFKTFFCISGKVSLPIHFLVSCICFYEMPKWLPFYSKSFLTHSLLSKRSPSQAMLIVPLLWSVWPKDTRQVSGWTSTDIHYRAIYSANLWQDKKEFSQCCVAVLSYLQDAFYIYFNLCSFHCCLWRGGSTSSTPGWK